MQPIYVIGDIHGHLDKLSHAMDLIHQDGGRDAKVLFIGDLIDRGPDSRGVIDALMVGQAQGRDWTVLKGNHDRMFEWFLQSPPRHDAHLLVGMHWFHEKIGGIETMASYGITVDPFQDRLFRIHEQALKIVPSEHITFLNDLNLYHETNSLIFVHAGIQPNVSMPDQDPEDLLWLRPDEGHYPRDMAKIVVHGHTPIDQPTHFGTHINVDGGAAFGRAIVPVVITQTGAYRLTSAGRETMQNTASVQRR